VPGCRPTIRRRGEFCLIVDYYVVVCWDIDYRIGSISEERCIDVLTFFGKTDRSVKPICQCLIDFFG
jgi:hypothetical protein